MTGVPHAIASIIIGPNGSSQSIGEISARASIRSSTFSASPTSPHVLDRAAEVRPDELVEVADLERLAALCRDLQRVPSRAPPRAHDARPCPGSCARGRRDLAPRFAPQPVHQSRARSGSSRSRGGPASVSLTRRGRDELRGRREREHLLVHPARLPSSAVHGVTERHVEDRRARARASPVVVDDIDSPALQDRVHGVSAPSTCARSTRSARSGTRTRAGPRRESPEAKSVSSSTASTSPSARSATVRSVPRTPAAAPGTKRADKAVADQPSAIVTWHARLQSSASAVRAYPLGPASSSQLGARP